MRSKGKRRIRDMAYVSLFSAVIAVCSMISVPFTVPFTMQTFAVFLTLFTLGGKRGTLSLLAYVCLGLCGMPIFSGFTGGVSAFFGLTGGYLVGFILCALLYTAAEKLFGKSGTVRLICAVVGLAVCYVSGSVWFMLLYGGGTGKTGFFAALMQCALPFIVPDALKIGLAFMLHGRIEKYIKNEV